MALIIVNAGDSLQTALNNAVAGDIIQLQAGATFQGPFTLPNKAGATDITIQSSRITELPPDVRVGPGQSSLFAKLINNVNGEAVVKTAASAHNYKFLGIEFAPATTSVVTFDILRFGDSSYTSLSQVPHHLTLDRCYVHGLPGMDTQRGVSLNCANGDILNCYISEIHGQGFDTQAICGWNGPGPFRLVNNYLEAAGENVLFGGADPAIQNLVPANIEIRRNYVFKPLSWKVGDPSYAGFHWTIKNCLELKNAQNVVIDGNVFENCWLDAQVGIPILFTVRNQGDTAPWSIVKNVTFTNNTVKNCAGGVNFLGWDNEGQPGQRGTDAIVQNNLFTGLGAEPFVEINGFYNVTINHNTSFQTRNYLLFYSENSTGFIFRNNLSQYHDFGIVGFDSGGNSIFGTPVFAVNAPGSLYNNNVLVGAAQSGFTYSTTGNNFYPAQISDVGFVDFAGGNYRLSSTSPFHNAGTDGKDIGCDISALLLAQSTSTAPPAPPAPTVGVVLPTSGPTAGGTSFALTGTGFSSGATVTFGDTSATGVVVDSSTGIHGLTPPHTAGTTAIVVTNPDGQVGSLTNAFTFVEPTPPPPEPIVRTLTVASSTPDSGVSISVSPADNNGLDAGTTMFNRSYKDQTLVTLTAPALADSNTFVKWQRNGLDFSTNPMVSMNVTANATLTAVYQAPAPPPPTPVTHSLAVTSASPNSGVPITVNLLDKDQQGNGTTVFFRTYDEGTAVTLTAPTSAGGNQFARWLKGGSFFTSSLSATFVMNSNLEVQAVYETIAPPPPTPTAPTITAVTPSKGLIDGGLKVIVTGTRFKSGIVVTFDGVPATSVALISSTSLSCITPAHAVGKVSVKVLNTDGLSATRVSAFQYTKNGRPKNANLSPNGGLIVL